MCAFSFLSLAVQNTPAAGAMLAIENPGPLWLSGLVLMKASLWLKEDGASVGQ